MFFDAMRSKKERDKIEQTFFVFVCKIYVGKEWNYVIHRRHIFSQSGYKLSKKYLGKRMGPVTLKLWPQTGPSEYIRN